MLGQALENVRKASPLIHNITNYVTVNDCANILLAAGASPIMADDVSDAAEITAICGALNINIGTLNDRTIPAMFETGKIAGKLGHPIVLDPVGAGASSIRTQTAKALAEQLKLTVIRGNVSELKALIAGVSSTKGVDADIADKVTKDTLDNAVSYFKQYAARQNAIIAVTGEIDIITDGTKTYTVYNGKAEMGRITGTGCMLTCLIAAYLAANPNHRLEATVAAVAQMGLAGELAFARLGDLDGNATYRNYIIDAVYHMDQKTLDGGARYDVR